MATFFMIGKYSPESFKEMSPERTSRALDLLKELGGKIQATYALLGEQDLVFIVDLPGVHQAMKASVILTRLTGIAFSTTPAVTVEEFDKLMTEI
jgi:uncharacterized protein with GYD domain